VVRRDEDGGSALGAPYAKSEGVSHTIDGRKERAYK
jgi:hypothetical protein